MHLRQAIDGDVGSVEWIVTRLSPLVLAHARYRLGRLAQQHDPRDIAQEAWLTTLPRLRDLTPRHGRLTPVLLRFLATAVLNRVRNIFYEQARRGDVQSASQLSADHSGAVTKAIQAERVAAVHATLDQLEPAEREVVLLRGVEQVSAPAAAVLLGVSVDAVHKRYQRALARLRASLPGSVFDEVES
jgi:RNA polymerase sigma factor (sigma-70 family)